jgi:predicted ATPase
VFVMTDVVGSTALWETHGDAMREALEVHDGLVHGAVEAAGGRVFKHTGDGMIAAFDDADGAVAGALHVVDALAGGEWGSTGALEVRVSVHAGTASERDGDFFGPPVNKAARINGVGHGGQVLVSDIARQLMSDPAGADLGVHQLRDLAEPVRLWQLDDGVYPPLRTLKKARHNLPVMPTEFIGRQAEVDELRSLVDHHRLVTITGVGGCGKTRLAVEVAAAMADRFPGGVWFVDLTTERDGGQVGSRAIGALGLVQQLDADADGPVAVLDDATAGAATLLVVDNCEHLIDDVADFATDVLSSAPSVTVLATSREALNVDGEWAWRIPNLHDAAVELFLARASAAGVSGLDNHHVQIEEICAQLDDIPLAIELAAARLTSLSIDELAERLDDRFSLLSGGRSRRRQRQQTLQAMMDWSYGLLNDDEQGVLNQLAVFAGTFPLAGIEAVTTNAESSVLNVLDSLVKQSLVVPSVDSGRYRLLETVRLYALDRLLNTDQLAATRDRHLAWMVDLSGAERVLSTGEGETWDLEEQKFAEIANADAAMEWAEQSGKREALLSLYIGGQTYWPSTGGLGVSWLDRVPEPPASEPVVLSSWLATSGHIRQLAGDENKAYEQLFAAAAIADELIETGRTLDLGAWASLLYRGLFLASTGDTPAAIADADRLSEGQIEGESRYHEWMSLMVRVTALGFDGDVAASGTATQLVAIGRTISRIADETSVSILATWLSLAGRFDEALPAAMQCLNSPVLPQTPRINMLLPAVRSLAGLGRYDDALEVVEQDFGPMIDAQRERLQISQIIGLIMILHELQSFERINDLAGVTEALAPDLLWAHREARLYLADVIGGDDAFAALPTPDPTELTPDRIAALINDIITEIRDVIVQDAPDR